jgi:hypothetical protein
MHKTASTTDSTRVSVGASRTIDSPVDRVWAEVANFNNVAKWHPREHHHAGRGRHASLVGCGPLETQRMGRIGQPAGAAVRATG